MKANNDLGNSVRRLSSRQRLGLFGSLAILVLVVAACGSAAAPTPQPAAMETAVAPTEIAAVPTEPAPLPTDTALPPTKVPPPTEAPTPTEAPAPEASLPASVAVTDQDISGGSVTVDEVVSAGPGWLVIHAQADGKPGPILGYSPVVEGVNEGVNVEIDLSGATETLYAMLHIDAGEPGTWEFPGGPDLPVQVDGQVVTPSFKATGGRSGALAPSVSVSDQGVVDGAVTIDQVISEGPGWLVIHAESDGKPGPILGYSPVAEGENEAVRVEIDLTGATGTLYAMLHSDAGTTGAWEFPNGPDAPVEGANGIVTTPFALQVAEGEVEVAMRQFQFDPAVLVVKAGTTVTWVNEDGGIEHNVQSDTGLWESELYAGGGSFSHTFEGPGVYPYHCRPHGDVGGVGMSGTIIVIP